MSSIFERLSFLGFGDNFLSIWCMVIVLCATIAGTRAAEVSPPIKQPLDAIRQQKSQGGLPMVAGDEHGYPGSHRAFPRNYPIIEALATRQDVVTMLGDSDPSVRLVGAKIALKRQVFDPPFFDLARDTSLVWVGPVRDGREVFRPMKVADAMVILRNDPELGLKTDYRSEVVVDYLREITPSKGTQLILGSSPAYPEELERAGVNGSITVRLAFRKGVAAPEIKVIASSFFEFEESTLWALSRWRLQPKSPKDVVPSIDSEFECRFLYKIDD